jgi:AbrB family looped-hinge helix DNA binding protein
MAIKVADDGQVTIPRHILQQLGVGPGSEVDVRHVANGTLVIEKVVLAEAPTVIPGRGPRPTRSWLSCAAISP